MKHCLIRKIIAALFIQLLIHSLQAQQFTFSHYKLDKGLAASLLMQDSKGYLWIGSDGLFRFDGVNALHFTNDPKIPGSLANNSIKSIAEDTDGTIWVGTLNGISHYDPSTNKFTNYFHKENDSTSINTNVDNILFVDEHGIVWIGNRDGVLRFNKKQQTFTHYSLQRYQQAARIKGSFISSIINDNADKRWLWMASHDGLIHFRKSDGFAVYYYPSNIPITLNRVFMDSHKRLWICTWGMGIGTFNQQTKKFSCTLFEKDLQLGTSNIASDIKEKQLSKTKSIFYLCTSIGFTSFIVDTTTNTNHLSLQNFLVADPAQAGSIGGISNTVLPDRQGIIWVATSNDLSYVLPNNQVFINFHVAGSPLGSINNITKDKSNDRKTFYWISSWYGGGLLKCDADFTKAERVNYFDKLIRSKNGTQINAALSSDNKLWVASMDGLFMYDTQTKNTEVFHHNTPNVLLPSDKIFSLCIDHFNHLWIGTYDNGFAVMDLSTQKSIPLNNALLKQCAGKKVNVIHEDSKGYIWLNNSNELVKVNESNFQFTVYRNDPSDLHSKAAEEVTGVIEDKLHRTWISSREGLNLYNPATNNFTLFTTADGLSNNNIESIACDNSGYLWIATAKGLNRMDPKNFHIKSYYNDDGIEKDNNLNYLLCDSNRIIIGCDNLITSFDPSSLIKNATAPSVYINSVSINNKNKIFFVDDASKRITLDYNENYFTIDFIALNFINADQNKYAYKLEGLDKNFIQLGNAHRVVYTNVGAGTYIFKVKAANNDDVWNNTGASIIIKINPPFWQTWWFIFICAVLVLLLMYIFYRYRIEQLLKVERLRSKISTDLHDDIGSTLSSISILSDMVLKHKDDENAAGMLQEIKDNSINLMEKMDDIVWSINPKNDTLENLMLRIKRFASQLFEAKNIDYSIQISESIAHLKLSMEKRQHLYLIIKESSNNIIKHSNCSYAAISAIQNNGELVVEIKDNGKGFNTTQPSHGNGLLSLQQRAKLMNAQLAIRSANNEGTIITVHVKIK